MRKKIDYILYLEHITREMESIKLVHNELKRRGYEGYILPIHYNRYYYPLKYDPKVVAVPYLYSIKNSTLLKYQKLNGNVLGINLHHEQITNPRGEGFMMPSDEYSKEVEHISWGKAFKNFLTKNGVKDERIHITGSIRNDLLIKDGNNRIPGDIKNTFTSYEDIIFIPTAFSFSFVTENYINNYLSGGGDAKHIDEELSVTRKTRDLYFKYIYKASNEYPHKLFVVRPHPHVDITVYKKQFINVNNIMSIPNNILIIREGPISDWLKVATKVFCWQSTSSLESIMVGKETYLLYPVEVPEFMKMKFMDHMIQLNTYEDFKNKLLKNKKDYFVKEELKDFLNHTYGVIDGDSYKRVADVVENFIEKHDGFGEINKEYKKSMIIKSLLIDFPKNVLWRLKLLQIISKEYKGIIEDNFKPIK